MTAGVADYPVLREALPKPPGMNDADYALAIDRMAARLRGEPHVHTRLCACAPVGSDAWWEATVARLRGHDDDTDPG